MGLAGRSCSRQDVGLGLVEEARELRQLGPQLIGHLAPLGLGRLDVLLGEGRSDEGRDDGPAAPAGAGP